MRRLTNVYSIYPLFLPALLRVLGSPDQRATAIAEQAGRLMNEENLPGNDARIISLGCSFEICWIDKEHEAVMLLYVNDVPTLPSAPNVRLGICSSIKARPPKLPDSFRGQGYDFLVETKDALSLAGIATAITLALGHDFQLILDDRKPQAAWEVAAEWLIKGADPRPG